jgi:hypothetical protein
VRRCSRCTHPAFVTDRYCLNCGQPLRTSNSRWRWLVGCTLLLLCVAGARAGGLAGAPFGTAAHWNLSTVATTSQARPLLVATSPVTSCRFVLGFKTLHDLVPTRVGPCLDNERYDPANGTTVQHTRGGLLVWRKADNGTAFTDGRQTWVLGPFGLQERPNGRRFRWEANPTHLPVIARAIA